MSFLAPLFVIIRLICYIYPTIIMPRSIAVGGDLSVEWLIYPTPESRDGQPWINGNFGLVRRRGGAALLAELLRQAKSYHQHDVFGPLREPESNDPVHSLVDLLPPEPSSDNLAYRVDQIRYVNRQSAWILPTLGETDLRILVLEDPGNGSQPLEYPGSGCGGCRLLEEPGVRFLRATRPKLLVYKMARPLATGRFWDAIRRGPYVDNEKQDDTRLIVIVDADDVRAEGLELSRHLSWERTAEDFVRHIASNGKLATLASSAHLIVRFDCDGVIHYQGRSGDPPTIYFDSENAEGDFVVNIGSGSMEGVSSAFTAGLVSSLAKTLDPATANSNSGLAQSIDAGIHNGILVGLHNARHLASTGFRLGSDDRPDYPCSNIMQDMRPEAKIGSASIPTMRISGGLPWSILLNVMGDPGEIARYIVRDGPRSVLGHVPTASFGRRGRLTTADRWEIENFRSITNLVQEYLRTSPMLQARPLSIGAFGPPGSGKSFGVMEVIQQAVQGRQVKRLDFNLSQFGDYSDLLAAFQLIRDRTLSGALPLVLFDEFDTGLSGSKLGWLRYFLAPMQEGKFLDHGRMHPLGPAILIFIGGTSSTLARFISDTQTDDFIAAKGPDFVSRLRGFVNIVGPDPTDNQDRMYPIRRAILLRCLLEKRLLIEGERIGVDDAVLTGLLNVPKFRHGARSLEAILAMSRVSGRKEFERAALPPESQLNLHVDEKEFIRRVRYQGLQPDELRQSIAKKLYAEYQKVRRETAQADTDPQSDPALQDWNALTDELKETNYSAADDIVQKLRMIECYTADKVVGGDAVEEFTTAEIEKLAQREHERYEAELLQRHWRLGSRDISHRTSPFLKPWLDLTDDEKEIDRVLVRCIPRVLGECNYQVCRLKKGAAQVQP